MASIFKRRSLYGIRLCPKYLQIFSKPLYPKRDPVPVSDRARHTSPLPAPSLTLPSKTERSLPSETPPPTTGDLGSDILPACGDLGRYVALDCEMVGVWSPTEVNAKGTRKMVSALGTSTVVLNDRSNAVGVAAMANPVVPHG